MNNCCGMNLFRFLGKKSKMSVKESEDGLQINITPKDKDKIQEMKNLFKAMKEFCGCEGDTCECDDEKQGHCCS